VAPSLRPQHLVVTVVSRIALFCKIPLRCICQTL
jgi:hypothetical protein